MSGLSIIDFGGKTGAQVNANINGNLNALEASKLEGGTKTTVTNFDTARTPGIYDGAAGATGSPYSNTSGTLIVGSGGSGGTMQMFVKSNTASTDDLFVRHYRGSNGWSTWKELITDQMKATTADAQAGTNDTDYVTPAKTKAYTDQYGINSSIDLLHGVTLDGVVNTYDKCKLGFIGSYVYNTISGYTGSDYRAAHVLHNYSTADSYVAYRSTGNPVGPYKIYTEKNLDGSTLALKAYTASTVPSASANTNKMIYVSGVGTCFSNGVNWFKHTYTAL